MGGRLFTHLTDFCNTLVELVGPKFKLKRINITFVEGTLHTCIKKNHPHCAQTRWRISQSLICSLTCYEHFQFGSQTYATYPRMNTSISTLE